jgi:hypothetical protein
MVEEMSFTDLTSDQAMKVVLFHDETVAESNQVLSMMESLASAGNFAEYSFKKCSLNAEGNEGAKTSGLTGGSLFTQTPESGIEQFTASLSPESFAKVRILKRIIIIILFINNLLIFLIVSCISYYGSKW